MSWKEDEYEYVPTKFSLDRTVTEIFICLELLWPYIFFFTNEDKTGLLDLWNWERPLRSVLFMVILTIVFANPWLIWMLVSLPFFGPSLDFLFALFEPLTSALRFVIPVTPTDTGELRPAAHQQLLQAPATHP